jgi:hypothetical protein
MIFLARAAKLDAKKVEFASVSASLSKGAGLPLFRVFRQEEATSGGNETIYSTCCVERCRAAKLTFTVLAFLLFASVMPRAFADDKPIPGIIPCSRVFVIGDQLYAVQWANKNLFKSACMAPQPTPATATYVLELRSIPEFVKSGLTSGTMPVASENYSLHCYSFGASTTCKNSSGAAYTTTCHVGKSGVDCDTYNGVSMGEALVKLPIQIILRNSARAYLFDAKTNEQVWKYDGNRPWDTEFAYAGQCVKEKRAGVWGVPDSQKSRCVESKLPAEVLEPGPVVVGSPAKSSADPVQVESPADKAKKAQQYAGCLNLALDNSQIKCSP